MSPGRGARGQRGFTVIEVLIALLVLLIGMAGILSLQLTSVQATAFSRHATEATLLAEDKMEELRAVPAATLVSDNDQVDARGVPDPQGYYIRDWEVEPGASLTITVKVRWNEEGADPYSITLQTLRAP
jgi:prepilin-type N-terminal cleavage/methylation domain-containing protein